MNKLKGYRVMANLKQKDMAELLQISRPAYNMKENGVNKFTPNEKNVVIKFLTKKIPNIKMNDIFSTFED